MVSEPPPSTFRAAPRIRFIGSSAAASTPPDSVRPDGRAERLYARPSRVRESSSSTTSSPRSTKRFARSTASSATATCSAGGRSKVDAITSPRTVRRSSVTSSGRSSASSTSSRHSGWLTAMPWAISLSTVVFPAFGGETTRARWPLPIGVTRSMTRDSSRAGVVSSSSRRSGCTGTRSAKCGRGSAGSAPWTLVIFFGGAGDFVAGTQLVLAHEGKRQGDVVRRRRVAGADDRSFSGQVKDSVKGHELSPDEVAGPRTDGGAGKMRKEADRPGSGSFLRAAAGPTSARSTITVASRRTKHNG